LQDDGRLKDAHDEDYPSIVYVRFELSKHEQFFKRKVYTLFDMIGDIGALRDGLILFLGFFLNSYSESHFLNSILENLFTVKNSDESPSIPKKVTGRVK